MLSCALGRAPTSEEAVTVGTLATAAQELADKLAQADQVSVTNSSMATQQVGGWLVVIQDF